LGRETGQADLKVGLYIKTSLARHVGADHYWRTEERAE
jgi:hypothetical protein